MADFIPYPDLSPEQRQAIHIWLRGHRVDPGRVPVYATFERDAATGEWRIPAYWVDADGRMRVDAAEDVRKVVLRRRELQPLPWPRVDVDVLGECEDLGDPCPVCSGDGCPECRPLDYAWRDGRAVPVETVDTGGLL